jgi:hypothetical protein
MKYTPTKISEGLKYYMDVCGCKQISDEGLKYYKDVCGCKRISD